MASYRWLFWLLAATGLILDQTSKYGIFGTLCDGGNGGTITVVENYFTIESAYVYPPEVWEKEGTFLDTLRTISGDYRPKVNEGALFGLGRGYNWLFTAISFAAAVLIVVISCRASFRRDFLLCVALGLILAGCLGNFYDRLVFAGVRDFIHWFIGERMPGGQTKILYDWPVFNIADCCLVVGAGTLLLHAFFFSEPASAAAQARSQEPASVPS